MENKLEEFYNLALQEFGEKFTIKNITMSDEDLIKFNKEFECEVTQNDIQEYQQVWLLENKCPSCNSDLGGLFGSFEWGIRHGYGMCSNCRKIELKYYHYIGNCKVPLKALALTGF